MESVEENGAGEESCGDWKLLREIGRGAYGTVHLAVGPGGEHAAVKVCRRDAVGDERYERELRGAKLYRSIPPQEGLVRMRALAETDWGFYTVMDLADDEFGGSQDASSGYRPKTLARVIDGEKALPLKECVGLAIALAKGLAALQRHHLLHRDIKPANVLYVGGRPVLSDPGLVVEETAAVSTVGTPGYLPPERKFTDAAGDIYSLGLTLKAASFGRQLEELDKGPAMEADTGAALFPAWWRILNKATDPTPAKRHQSAKALLKDLAALRRKMRVSAVLGSRMAKAAIVVGAMAIVAAAAFAVIAGRRAQRELAELNDRVERQSREERQRIQGSVEKGVADIQGMLGDLGIPADIAIQPESESERNKQYYIKAMQHDFWNSYDDGRSTYFAKKNIDEARRGIDKIRRFAETIKGDVAKIGEIDKTRASALQTLIDKALELIVKEEDLQRQFDELRGKAKEKESRGLEAVDEFLRAQKIVKEMESLSRKLTSGIDEVFYKRKSYLGDIKHKWDHCLEQKKIKWELEHRSWSVDPYMHEPDKIQLVVDKTAAFDKTKSQNLMVLKNRFAELMARQKSLRREISALREEGEKQTREGMDDMAEYRRAWKIYEEECRLIENDINPLAQELAVKLQECIEDYGIDGE